MSKFLLKQRARNEVQMITNIRQTYAREIAPYVMQNANIVINQVLEEQSNPYPESVKCPFCQKDYSTSNDTYNIFMHIKHHKQRQQNRCPKCRVLLQSYHDVIKHECSIKFRCMYCQKLFDETVYIQQHLRRNLTCKRALIHLPIRRQYVPVLTDSQERIRIRRKNVPKIPAALGAPTGNDATSNSTGNGGGGATPDNSTNDG